MIRILSILRSNCLFAFTRIPLVPAEVFIGSISILPPLLGLMLFIFPLLLTVAFTIFVAFFTFLVVVFTLWLY